MKYISIFIHFLLKLSISLAYDMPEEIETIKAPFDMPQLKKPTFPNLSMDITKTGAKQNKLSTSEIQKAIDEVAKNGGGVVNIPKGQWLSGRLELKSNINLHFVDGAELTFSGDIKDYLPVVLTRNEGVDVYSLGAMIYANGAENIALTGNGKIFAPSRDCEIMQHAMGGVKEELQDIPLDSRLFDGSNGGEVCLPTFFGPINCKNILVENVKFLNSIFWNIAPIYCENIIIRGIEVSNEGLARTDGIDIDSSVNALIEYTTLDCDDDAFTLKAGRGKDGILRNKPTENVVIRYCTVKSASGGVVVGTETAAMVRNVYMYDCIMENPNFPLYFKTRRPRGGGGEYMWFEKIHVLNTKKNAFRFDMLGDSSNVGDLANRFPAQPVTELTPVFRNLNFKDITVDNCEMLINAKGLPESPIENLTFESLVSNNKNIFLQDVGTVTFK